MIGENPIKTNKAKAEDQIIIYYATNAAAARCGASVAPYAPHTRLTSTKRFTNLKVNLTVEYRGSPHFVISKFVIPSIS